MKQTFELEKEVQDQMVRKIQNYFKEERNDDLGDLAAFLILDFFLNELAPIIYNQGIEDAHVFMSKKLDDLFELQKR